jgi:tetratricopeptide (TPR) repeat protein
MNAVCRIGVAVAVAMLVAGVAGARADGAAAAAGDVAAARPLEPARPWAYKRIDRAYDDLAAERYDLMLETLDEMRRNHKLNVRERALMWQAYAYAYTSREQYPQAAEAMEQCLAAQGLDESATMQMRYNLAQIYVLLERPEDAIREFTLWFAAAPNPSGAAYYMYAMAQVQQGDKAEALRLARRAVEQGGAEAKEPWRQLVASILIEQKRYAEAVPVLQALIERHGKKIYWLQLSAVYSGLEQSDRALAVLELAHRQGLLTQRSELMTLAQLYLYNQIPARAASVLDEGIRAGVIEPWRARRARGGAVGERQRLHAAGAGPSRARGLGAGARRARQGDREGPADQPRARLPAARRRQRQRAPLGRRRARLPRGGRL